MIITYISIALILLCIYLILEKKEAEPDWFSAIFDGSCAGIAIAVVAGILINILGLCFVPEEPVVFTRPLYQSENGSITYNGKTYSFLIEDEHGWKSASIYSSDKIYFVFTEENEAPYLEIVKERYVSGWWDFLVFYEGELCGTDHYTFHIPKEEFPPEYLK